jgi:hypothetical protein
MKRENIVRKIYNDYQEDKTHFYANNKVIEYLFNKTPNNDDDTVRTVRLCDAGALNIIIIMSTYRGLLEKSNRVLKEIEYMSGNTHTQHIVSLPRLTPMSTIMRDIYLILFKAEERYNMAFTYKYSLECLRGKIILSDTYQFDFFGAIISHRQLVFFVILFDKNYHFLREGKKYASINQRDIDNQKILKKMNIHLLRLRKHDNINLCVHRFLSVIKNSREYVIVRGIAPVNYSPSKRYLQFSKEYSNNHTVYHKIPLHNVYDSEDEFHDQYIMENCEGGDYEYNVDKDDIRKIIKEMSARPKSKDIETARREGIVLLGFQQKKVNK